MLDWNQVALDAIRHASVTMPPEDPGYVSRALAMESIAMFDVLQAINHHPGFLVSLGAPSGIASDAAVSAAAHEILVELFPDYKPQLDHAYEARLAQIHDGPAESQGVAFGEQVADAVIAARAHDGSDELAHLGLVAGYEPGEYRPTPPDYTEAIQPDWGDVTPFVLQSASQFRPGPPPALTSAEYAAAFNEVKALGGLDSTERTPEQTQSAIWWSNDQDSYTRVGQWSDIADHLLADQGRSPLESAYLLTELNVGLADALIACWDTKYTYDAWRPITAIQEANTDGNPATTADPDWTPLLPTTPDHPEYTSGHAVIGALAAKVMTGFFGPIPFSATSETLPDVVLHFDNFTQAAADEALSRVYGGVHFAFSAQAGLVMGGQVGDVVVDAFQKFDIPASDGHLV
ncbi:vanadium-dependent haloperoxidase [Methylobacterium nigriterrae]|uniref:vanadium-dependent haloperoxidase n=1 Tax=Methylobacterium nigriterrae TaxID=3127512 RepID=UPI00301353D7